jgi:hypothetical protein
MHRLLNNTVVLDHCGTTFAGSFAYPPPREIDLSPIAFTLRYAPHCLLAPQGTVHGCPSASLTSYGYKCEPEACQGACCYRCDPGRPVAFPTPVRFEIAASEGGKASAKKFDPLQWEQELRFPGDQVAGFVAAEQRRVFLAWPKDESRNWTDNGKEIDALEIVGPDGHVRRIENGTSTLGVPGLQCQDRFTYQYRGRWPDKPRQQGLDGDTLRLEPSLKRQRTVSLAVRTHAGALRFEDVNGRPVFSPFFDVAVAVQHYSGFEAGFAGVFGLHPSLARFQTEAPQREMSALARVVFDLGWRFYLNPEFVLIPTIAGGVAFPALAADWTRSRIFPVLAANVRFGYEVSRATTLELDAWLFWPEEYVASQQDLAGPRDYVSRSTWSVGLGAGIHWAGVL